MSSLKDQPPIVRMNIKPVQKSKSSISAITRGETAPIPWTCITSKTSNSFLNLRPCAYDKAKCLSGGLTPIMSDHLSKISRYSPKVSVFRNFTSVGRDRIGMRGTTRSRFLRPHGRREPGPSGPGIEHFNVRPLGPAPPFQAPKMIDRDAFYRSQKS